MADLFSIGKFLFPVSHNEMSLDAVKQDSFDLMAFSFLTDFFLM